MVIDCSISVQSFYNRSQSIVSCFIDEYHNFRFHSYKILYFIISGNGTLILPTKKKLNKTIFSLFPECLTEIARFICRRAARNAWFPAFLIPLLWRVQFHPITRDRASGSADSLSLSPARKNTQKCTVITVARSYYT